MLPFLPSRLLKNLQNTEWRIKDDALCNSCNKLGAITFTHELYSDFNIEKHKNLSWMDKFTYAEDGICMSCGHFQRYSSLTRQELDEYLSLFSDKSKTNEGLISKSSIYKGEDRRTKVMQALRREHLRNVEVNKIYMARPSSFKMVGEAKNIFRPQNIDIVENNEVIKSEIIRVYGHNDWLNIREECQVHGKTDFPPEYDLYVITHCLQHSINLKDDLDSLEKQVKLGAKVLLLDEVQRKIHNPFHVNHMSEVFLTRELRNRGLYITLIQDMTGEADETIKGLQSSNNYTGILVYG